MPLAMRICAEHSSWIIQLIYLTDCILYDFSSCRQRDVFGTSIRAAWKRSVIKRRAGYWCCFPEIFRRHQRIECINENIGTNTYYHYNEYKPKRNYAIANTWTQFNGFFLLLLNYTDAEHFKHNHVSGWYAIKIRIAWCQRWIETAIWQSCQRLWIQVHENRKGEKITSKRSWHDTQRSESSRNCRWNGKRTKVVSIANVRGKLIVATFST